MQLIRFTLFDHFDSYIVWIWFCPGLRFVSIINSVKICVDYCPVYGFCWFYHAPVCWLCDDQSRKSLGRYSLSMISFYYNWNNLPIVALDWMISIYWYNYNESMMVTIIILVISVNCVTLSERSLWKSLWMMLCMFRFDYNRNSLVFDMNFMHSSNQSIMIGFDYNYIDVDYITIYL